MATPSAQDRSRLDASGMLGRIDSLPDVVEAAYARGRAVVPPLTRPDAVVICGMGGSAISGDIVRTLWLGSAPCPVVVHRGDTLPSFADERTLAVFMSYSGQTGETLGALQDALARGVPALGVSVGGQLTERLRASELPVVPVPAGYLPRAAIAELCFSLLGTLSHLHGAPETPVDEVVAALRAGRARLTDDVPEAANPAKALARRLYGKLPLVLGATPTTEAAASRFKAQLNENSKQTALFGLLPEFTHNDIVNFGHRPHPEVVAVVFEDPDDSRFVATQRRLTLEVLAKQFAGIEVVEGTGKHRLTRTFELIQFGDYVSVYLAYLHDVDPTPVAAIFDLKARMTEALG